MPSLFLRTKLCLALSALVFLLGSTPLLAQSKTIVIDAGHGGFDRGGVPRQRIPEKVMALDVAQRLKRILEGKGYRVIMTRNSDVFLPLGRRTAIANSYRGATFISVHFNSASRAGANGIETYYYNSASATLAANIHRNVVAVAPFDNRGIRRRGFFVLRRTRGVAVLLELGFLTNPSEGRAALQPAYRQRLAEAVARGIQGFRAPISKPLTPGAARSADVLPQQRGPDFVQPGPRRRVVKKSKRTRKKSSASRKSKSKKSSSGKKKSKRR